MFDLAIVGGGPAGLSCAITARKRNLSAVVISAENENSWLKKTDRIDNYPGLPAISGKEMLQKFAEQAKDAGVSFIQASARQIAPKKRGGFMILCGADIIEARTVCLCMGVSFPKLIEGESELIGSGVSWCGTCDGMFFRGKEVAVLSGWSGGDEEAEFLGKLASKVDCYSILGHKGNASGLNWYDGIPNRVSRENGRICLHFPDREKAEYDGVFVFRPTVAPATILAGIEMDGSFVKVDRQMNTNIHGVCAAGDITGLPLQIAKAVGEGNVAAITCAGIVEKIKKNAESK